MKGSVKTVTLASFLVLGLALAAGPVQAQIGFAAGYSLNLISDAGFSSPAKNSLESSGGINLGAFYEFRMGQVTLRPGLFYQQNSFDWTLRDEANEEIPFSPLQSNIKRAEIPIDLMFSFPLAQISPYVVAGPSWNFIQTSQPDLRITLDNEKGSTNFMALNIGAGLQFSPGGLGLILSPEVRYSYALSGILKEDYIVRTIPYQADESQRFSSFTFRLNVAMRSFY